MSAGTTARAAAIRRSIPAAALAFVLLAASAAAQEPRQRPPAPGEPENFVIPKPARATLPNGFRVTTVPFGQIPKVRVQLLVEAANAHERADQVWLADVTGRMLEEGTASLGAEALARELAGMGGQLAVTVSADRTSIATEVLAERAADAIRLIADVAQRPRFDEADLSRVKANLARELAIRRSTPQALAQEKFAALLYGDHPYGRLFPSEAMLEGYGIDEVRAFHRQHFAAARARLYVAGIFDAPAVDAAVREGFGGWARGSPGRAAAPPAPRGADFALIDRPAAPQSTVLLGLRVPDPSQPDWTALDVTNALLGGTFGSRITTNIREQKGYTYSPFSAVRSHPRTAHWVQTADVTTAVTGPALQEVFAEIDRLRAEPPPAAELRGIQNNIAGLFVVRNASRTGVINQLAFVDLHGLGDDWLPTYVKRVMAVTPADVQRIARDHLVPAKMTLVVVGDTGTIDEQIAPWKNRGTP